MIKTLNLDGTVSVVIDAAHAHIRNDSEDTRVCVSTSPNPTEGEDGVLTIPPGQAASLYNCTGEIYIDGIGPAVVVSSNYAVSPFKCAPASTSGSGGGGSDLPVEPVLRAGSLGYYIQQQYCQINTDGMLRFSYGCNKDKLFDKHYEGCKSAGLYVGVYHWLRAQTPAAAKAEAEWLVRQLEKYSIDYPIALDFEDADLFDLKLTKAQYTAIVDSFMSVLQAANYYVVMYTNPDTINNRLNADVLERYDLWLAHWTTKPAAYGQTMWQYAALGTAADVKAKRATRVGTVQGAGGPCDVNWSYVGYAAKIKAAGKNRKKMQTNEPAAVNYAVIASKIATKNDLQKITAQLKAQGFAVNSFELKK